MRSRLKNLNFHLALVFGLCLGMIVVACSVGASLPLVSPLSPSRQAELDHLIQHDCGSCHGMTRKGGLGSPLIAEDLAKQEDEALAAIILEGIPGTPMPPWKHLLSEEDVLWIVHRLKESPPDDE
jgi:cytochrome c55X